MEDLTLELKAKFRAFHNAYELNYREMINDGMHGAVVAVKVWERTLNLVPLTKDELTRFKIYSATHSANAGKLFG